MPTRWSSSSGRQLSTLLVALAGCLCGCGSTPQPTQPEVRVHQQPGPAPAQGREKIVFIVLDALRPDHLSGFGYHRRTSPTLDRLVGEGFLLANMIVHSSQTVPSTLSMMTSLLPHQHGVHYWAGTQSFTGTEEQGAPSVSPELTPMAEHFSRAGYYTAGVVANPWLSADHGFARGFRTYVELDRFTEGDAYVYDGSQINRQVERLLTRHAEQRLFLYLHYMDVHSPYEGNPRVAPLYRPARGQYVYDNGPMPDLRPEDLDYTMALYDERIRHLDGLIAELLGLLEQAGLLEDTTLVVTSDHGDEFMEHGGLGHGTTLHRELIRSFCLFWNPRRFEPARIEGFSQAVDILPTLLGAHGIESPTPMEGLDRLAAGGVADHSRMIISELAEQKAILWDNWKYMVDANAGTDQLYYTGPTVSTETTSRDNLALIPPQVHQRMKELFAQTERSATLPLDPQARERLRALGYVD